MLVMQRNSDVLYQEKRIRASVQTLKFSLKCMLVFFLNPLQNLQKKLGILSNILKHFKGKKGAYN